MHCAVCLGAVKVFFPGEQAGLQLDGRLRSYPTAQELLEAIERKAPANMSGSRLRFLAQQQQLHAVDMVLAQAKRGAIYREVFTHSGSGTLLTREYPNILRPARETDVRDIMAMMQPSIENGSIKAVSEESLLRSIPSFHTRVVKPRSRRCAAISSTNPATSCVLPSLVGAGVHARSDAGQRHWSIRLSLA